MQFSDNVDRKVIPSGGWQRLFGILLDAVGLFAVMAATPFNGAGAVASICLAVGSSLLFWGLILKYFSTLEEKMLFVMQAYIDDEDVDRDIEDQPLD
ncbi:MAG: hypothetical protein JWO65_1056 [Sphingomonas bacterium]|jgi:hypothetical protein|nr:hypothetical protein [Sphingomonas bacterium]